MGEPWLKLYKKIGDHDIMLDGSALCLFIWLLTHVKPDGTIKVSKYLTSETLHMKPTTFYDALMRLVNKYKVATTQPTADYTIVTLIHWAKYQSRYGDTDHSTDQRPTTNRLLADTLYKNKELRIKNKDFEKNPIISDPIFTRLQSVYKPQSDGEIRQKMDLESRLSNKYSDFRYQNYWNEARSILKGSN